MSAIRDKIYWNYNNLNPKDLVALNLFTQKVKKTVSREKNNKRVKK